MFAFTLPKYAQAIARIGVDMDIFDEEKHLCSWCDSPSNNESAGNQQSVRIAKSGTYLKPMWFNVILLQLKVKNNTTLQSNMDITVNVALKKAIIAIARMTMAIYHIFAEKKYVANC